MPAPTKFSRAIAAYQGKDDPLSAENARLTAENAEFKEKAESFESIVAEASKAAEDHATEVSELKSHLKKAQDAQALAETAKASAEARADAAEAAAVKAKADAKTEIDAKEASVTARASRAAIDQMAKVGQPAPDDSKNSQEAKPEAKGPTLMSPEEGLRQMNAAARSN